MAAFDYGLAVGLSWEHCAAIDGPVRHLAAMAVAARCRIDRSCYCRGGLFSRLKKSKSRPLAFDALASVFRRKGLGMPYQVVAVGEILWDLLPSGKQLGGAPANFAFHAGNLGARAQIISRVGADPLGAELLDQARQRGLLLDTIAVDDLSPTGTVSVDHDPTGHHHFTIHENVAWDGLVADSAALEVVARADAICFGTLAQRCETSRRAVQTLVRAAPATALRVLDINLRQEFISEPVIRQSLTLANVLKLNDDELATLAAMLDLQGSTSRQLEQLAIRYDLRMVALTRGAHGSLLYSAGETAEQRGLPVRLRDSIGAGDAFCAAMTLGYLAGWSLDQINRRANETAAVICSHHGAFAPLPNSIRDDFHEIGTSPTATTPL